MKDNIKEKLVKIENIIKTHKVLSVVITVVVFVVGLYIYNQIQINKQLQRNIAQMETDRKNKELKKDLDNIVDDYKKESEAETNQLSDVLNKNRILVYDTKEIEHSNGYYTIQVTVENLGKDNVTYTKIGLNFKNDNGEIIQSDNIIDNNVIKPKAKQTLTKKVPDTVKYKTVESEVLEVK